MVVVSDDQGRLLNALPVRRGEDFSIPPSPSGYIGDLVSVYIVNIMDGYYQIHAFLNLKRGSNFYGPIDIYKTPQTQTVRIKLPQPFEFDRLTLSTNYFGLTLGILADTLGPLRIPYLEGSQFFGQVVSSGEGRCAFLNFDQQTNTILIDANSLTTVSLKKTVSLDPKVIRSSFSLVGTFDNSSDGLGYHLYGWSGAGHSFDVFYPNHPFAKYFTSISYTVGDRSYFEQRETSKLDLDFIAFGFSGEINKSNPTSFDMKFSGEFDYYTAEFSGDNASLSVYNSHHYETFSIPDFSGIRGLKRFPTATLKTVNIHLIDDVDYTETQRYFEYFTRDDHKISHNRRSIFMHAPVN